MTRDELDRHLARAARRLGLASDTLDGADEAALREFCEIVLTELAARGLLPGGEEPGCHATRRSRGN